MEIQHKGFVSYLKHENSDFHVHDEIKVYMQLIFIQLETQLNVYFDIIT